MDSAGAVTEHVCLVISSSDDDGHGRDAPAAASSQRVAKRRRVSKQAAAPDSPDVVCLTSPSKISKCQWSPVVPSMRAATSTKAKAKAAKPAKPAKKAAKVAAPKAAMKAGEKRAARLCRPSAKIQQRIDRAKQQRLYLACNRSYSLHLAYASSIVATWCA